MEMSGQLHAPSALYPRERATGTHYRGGLLGPRAGLDTAVEERKIPRPCRQSNPGRPTCSLVNILIDLSRFPDQSYRHL